MSIFSVMYSSIIYKYKVVFTWEKALNNKSLASLIKVW